MTEQTEKGMSRFAMPAILVTLVVGAWLGGVAYFNYQGGARSDAQAADAGSTESESDGPGEIPDAVLGSLGGLIGASIHQGYLNTGLLADAVEGKLYTPDEGKALLAAVSALIDTTEAQINKLPADKMQPEDQEHLKKFRAVLPPLKAQVKELRLYWETDETDHAERFQKARTEAQAALEALGRK